MKVYQRDNAKALWSTGIILQSEQEFVCGPCLYVRTGRYLIS